MSSAARSIQQHSPDTGTRGIECEKCNGGTFVSQSRNRTNYIVRIRTCLDQRCLHSFATYELKETDLPQDFDPPPASNHPSLFDQP